MRATNNCNACHLTYTTLVSKRITPLDYWQRHGCDWPLLQHTAVQLFTLCISSAVSERNFSTFGFISAKHCTRLSTATLDKLVYIKTNASLFGMAIPKVCNESDTEEDVSDIARVDNESV